MTPPDRDRRGDGRLDRLSSRARATAERAPSSASVARWGLGAMLLAAGLHKLLDPSGWTVYVTDWLTPLLVVSPRDFMLLNGVLELGFAALLLANRYVAFAAVVAAVSLGATTLYLAIVWTTTGAFGDVLARDIGLTALAVVVTLDALH